MVMFGTHLFLLALTHTWMTNQGWIAAPDSDPDQVPATHAQLANIGMVVISGLGSLGITLGWLRLMNDRPLQRLSLIPNRSDAWLGIKASVMLLPPVLMISALVSLFLPYNHEVLNLLQGVESGAVFLGMFFATAIVTPAFEEFLFRVLIQGGLQGMMDPGPSEVEGSPNHAWQPRSYLPIIVASVIFALLHLGQGAAPIPLFLLSLGLGYLYRQTGNITAPLVVHAMLNSLTMLAKFTEPPGAG
jgi:membrane protease YdiL (CAAX protease family)